MGTSTSTTFGPNGPVVVTTGGTIRSTTIRPVTVRALEAQSTRLERDSQRQQRNQQQAQATAFYRGQGEYSTLGAEGGYRPRGTVTSGGVPVGQAVPANNGLVGGMPAGDNGDSATVAQLQERLAQVAQERGPQIGDGNPNDNAAAPRYPQDHYYDSLTGNLWQWQGATEDDPGAWIILQERGPQIGDGNPNDNAAAPRYPQDHYYDTATGNLWQWQGATEDDPGEWIILCGTLEVLPFVWDSPEATTRVIDPYQHYPVRVEALLGVSGATVVTIPAIGDTAAVGDAISITVSSLPDPVVPVVGSILLRRV